MNGLDTWKISCAVAAWVAYGNNSSYKMKGGSLKSLWKEAKTHRCRMVLMK